MTDGEHPLKGRKQSPEHIAKRVAKQIGSRRSLESKQKMRLAKLGKSAHPNSHPKKGHGKNHIVSQETRNKISEKQKGKHLSQSHRKNTSKGMKKYIDSLNDEQRKKRVEQWIKTGRTQFDSPVSSEELILGEYLKKKNIEFESQYYIRPYYVDFYIDSKNTIIEYYGCFWHQCKKCDYDKGHSGYSSEEIRSYDLSRMEHLQRLGYKVIVVWGHDLIKYR